jgi:hypothetical protein
MCLTMRYPYSVMPQQQQDNNAQYPKPVTEQFYSHAKGTFTPIKYDDWQQCHKLLNSSMNHNTAQENRYETSFDKILYECFESLFISHTLKHNDQQEPIIYMYTLLL